ncbi:DoxX family protein [Promicromonospora sp. Marseille-Q5078]|uniref:DoxX family protein n=1 Tax=Isoptericola sp. NPDC019482 TaxID=3154688 RepID=UPI00349361D4
MTVAYWIVAALLAVFYGYAGGKKVLQGKEQLRPMMGWVDTIPMPAVRAIGTLEILGAIGLVLPPLTGVAPWLALVAAAGFGVLQVGATALHLSRGEKNVIGLNLVLVVLAAAAAWLATVWVG